MDEDELIGGWPAIVNRIIRGERLARPRLIVGPTPELLIQFGLHDGALTMVAAKVALCRKRHPEVSLEVWHNLPDLLADPLAIFPSAKRDGTQVVLLVVTDRDGHPVVVAIAPDPERLNAVLSVYGKENGWEWAAQQIADARADGLPTYEKKGFAASLPQPPATEVASSSSGPIPADGTAKPKREILSVRKKST